MPFTSHIAKLTVIITALALLGACTPKASQKDSKAEQAGKEHGAAHVTVDADNIYNLLVANIAFHRQQDKLALLSLSKVAEQTQNVRLLEDAILLAYQLNDEPLMRRLNSLLVEADPNNEYAQLNLAYYAFKENDTETGTAYLIDYLKSLKDTSPKSIRNATSLIITQNRDTQDNILYDLTHTENVNTHLTAAIIYGLNQRQDLHLTWLEKTLDLQPDLEYAATLKLDQLLKNKAPMKQIQRFTQAHLHKHDSHIQFQMLYISHLIDQQLYDEAIDNLKLVIKVEPEHRSAHYILGLTYLEQQQTNKAIDSFKNAIKVDPKNDQTRFYLAEAYQQKQDTENAIAALNSITSDANFFEAQTRIGLILANSDSLDAGMNYLENIDTHSNEEKLSIIMLQESLLRQQEDWSQTLTLLNNALTRFPDNTELLYSRGYIHAMMNNIQAHEKDMRRVIQLDPLNAEAYNALGYTLADQTDRYEEALALIQKADELSPGSAYILDSLGWVYYRLNQLDIALDYLLQAFDILRDAEIATHIGEVYWQLGNETQAQLYWQQAKEMDADNANLIETMQRLMGDS